MRTTTFVLGVSLALNVALAAILLRPWPSGGSSEIALRTTVPDRSTAAAAAGTTSVWQQLSADNTPRRVTDRLRAAGFPEPVVRKVVQTMLHEEFEQKRHRITGDAELHLDPRKPWPNSWMDPKLGPQLRATMKEEQDAFRDLFGDAGGDTEEERAMRQQRYGDLSDDKIERVRKYVQEWNEKRMQIYSNRGGQIQLLPSEMDKLAEINRAMPAGLTAFLTPAEANEYLVRNGQYASQLQYMLGPLKLTEQEYRSTYALYEAYAEQFPRQPFLGNLDGLPADQAAIQKPAAQTLIAQLNASLPPDRAEQIQLALDPSFSSIGRLVNRLDLPFTAAKQVYDVQQSTLQQAKAINGDLSLTTDMRNAQLTELQQNATKDISNALGGKRGLNAYKQLGGAWLTSLVPKPKG